METPITPPAVIDESRFTPEQTLELARVRAETAQARAQLAELEERTQATAAERTALQRSEAERDALLASKVTFYNGPEALQMLRANGTSDVRFDPATKEVTAVVGKERVPLAAALRQFALDHPTLVDGRSLRSLKAEAQPKARSEMSRAEKIAYLNSHTAEEYEALRATPVQPVQQVQVNSLKEWNKLPVELRTRIVAEKGVGFIARLSRI
jgi:hypothetical protein